MHLCAHGNDLAAPWSVFRSHGVLHSRVPKKRIGGSGTFTGCVAPSQPVIYGNSLEGATAMLLDATAGMGARNSDIGRSGVTASSLGALALFGPHTASVGVSFSETHWSAAVALLLFFLALTCPVARPIFYSPAYRAMLHHLHGLRVFLRVFSFRLGPNFCVHPVPRWSMGWCILVPSLWGVALLHAHLPAVSWNCTWIEMQAASVLLLMLCQLLCGLLRLLLMPIGFHRTRTGRLLLCGVLWVPTRIVLALDHGRPTWTSQPPRRRASTLPVCLGRWHSSIWVRILCILALPGQVTAGPVGLYSGFALALSQLPDPVWGMARPPQPGDPPHGTLPGLIAPEELTAHIGVCSVPPLGQRPQVDVPPAPELFLGPLGQQAWSAGLCPEDKMLGIYVYTPYYSTVAVALKFHGPATLAQTCEAIRDRVPQVPVGPFDVVVPLRPQRFPEYPAFLRLPSIIKHQGADGHAGVVLDLTRVGGKYFATVLPKRLDYSILLQFVTPLTCHSELALCVYAAFFQNPWPTHVPLDLHDGDVLTFTHGPTAFVRHRIEPTFQPDGHWGALCHMPQVESMACLCVMYGDKRFSLPSFHYTGETVVQATARCLGRDPHDLTMCAFPLQDLDLHGDACLSAITVVDQPNNRQPDTLHSGRRDIFVLCDLRPLGLRPRFVYTNYPAVHLPSILSQLGLRVPPIFKIKVAGGTPDRDDITVDGSVTLLFYAVLRSADATDDEVTVSASRSNSDSEASAPEPPDQVDLDSRPETSPRDYEDLFVDGAPGLARDGLAMSYQLGRHEADGEFPPLSGSAPTDAAMTAHNQDGPGLGLRRGRASAEALQADGPAGVQRPHEPYQPNPPVFTVAAGTPPDDPADAAWRQVLALVYAPDYVPEVLEVPLRLPCGVEHAIQEVQAVRLENHSSRFPELYAALPQPRRDIMLFVAGPAWAEHHPLVLFDCRQDPQRVFVRPVAAVTTREALLHAAGFAEGTDHCVYVHGLLQALAPGQRLDLFSGMLVVITDSGVRAPATFDLSTMLLSDEHWDTQAHLPGPPHVPGDHFHILSDAGAFGFPVRPGRRTQFRADLALRLQVAPERLAIKPVSSPVVDCLSHGDISSGVLVATTALDRAAASTADALDHQRIIVVDCRPILQGFHWMLVPGPCVSLHELTARFCRQCPDGHFISFTGATVRNRPDGPVFLVEHGHLLSATFVQDGFREDPEPSIDDEDSLHPRPWPRPDSSEDRGSDRAQGRPRSRSPRPGSTRGALPPDAAASPSASAYLAPYPSTCWSSGPWPHAEPMHQPGASCSCVPLHPPADMTPPGVCRDTPCRDSTQGEEVYRRSLPTAPSPRLVDVAFGLLAPDYAVETASVQLYLPASVEQAAAAVVDAGSSRFLSTFPVLTAVHVQPDTRWGLFIAAPAWPLDDVIVCIDLCGTCRRMFAAVVPPACPVGRLRDFVSADSEEALDLYINGEGPLTLQADITLTTGAYVQFAPAGDQPTERRLLQDMLSPRHTWAPAPAFPAPCSRDRYGVITVNGPYIYDLLPARATRYREDVAVLAGCHARELHITPARPSPCDVSFHGHRCYTVFTALPVGSLAITQRPVAAVIDARPLLRGWVPVLTLDGWLDSYPLLQELLASLPLGWDVGFVDLPRDIRWVNLDAGQVFVAICFRDAPSPGAPSSTQAPRDNDEDTSSEADSAAGDVLPEQQTHHGCTRITHQSSADPTDSQKHDAQRQRSHADRQARPEDCCPPHLALGPSSTDDRTSKSNGPKCKCCADVSQTHAFPDGTLVGTSAYRDRSELTAYNFLIWGFQSDLGLPGSLPGSGYLIAGCYVGVALCLALLASTILLRPCSVRSNFELASETLLRGLYFALTLGGVGRSRGFHGPRCTTLAFSVLLVFSFHLSVGESVHLLPHSEAVRWVPKSALAGSATAPASHGEHASRPLPTPCRSRMPPPTHGRPASTAALVSVPAPGPSDLDRYLAAEIAEGTLLPQAARHSDEWAFLAATLLDTLLEHEVGCDCGARTPCCRVGQPIALAQHLPRHSSHDLTQVTFNAGLGPDEAASLLTQGVWRLRTDAPDDLHARPGFRTGPAYGPTRPHYEALHVYTDGSFGGVSSWAFAVFGLRSGTLTWLGWDGGRVVTDAGHAHYVGATHHSALCGEQCALAWATSWALQAPSGVPVAFFADCQVALRQTTGRYGSVAPMGLASVCRSLSQALQAARPESDPHISHVRSHTGHLPNEIVDALAKFSCKAEPRENDYSPHLCVIAKWCRSPQLPWLWLSFAALRQPTQWPTPAGCGYIDRHRLATQTPPAAATCRSYFGLTQTDSAASPICRFTAQLCIFNLNVQSLAEMSDDDDSSPQCQFPGRAAFLREQFDYYGAHIVALQEARASADSMFVSATHVRLCTGRDKQGNFGVELWFSRRHPFARIGDTALLVEPGDLLALHSDPRTLIVRYSRGPLRILFVSLHAPGATHPHRNAWWSTFQTRLGRLYGGEAVVRLQHPLLC